MNRNTSQDGQIILIKILIDFIKGINNRLQKTNEWETPLSVVYLFYDNYENPEIMELNYFENKITMSEI